MPTCYAITAGSYSDYHVCAVFTTRELAESECFMYGAEAKVEDFPLDPVLPKPPEGMKGFSCYEDTPAGVINVYEEDGCAMYVEAIDAVKPVYPNGLSTLLWAREESHAIKIASEKFAQYRAIQAGVA